MQSNRSYSVYIHTTPSGKVYVGITGSPVKVRWANGKGYASQKYFYNAIKKYGWENIEHRVICQGLTLEDAVQKEVELIRKYRSTEQEYGYNIRQGGETGNLSNVIYDQIKNTFNPVKFTKEDAMSILSIGSKMKKKNARRQAALEVVYYIFIIYSKAYNAQHPNNLFQITLSELKKAGASQDNARLANYIKDLIEMGFIQKVDSKTMFNTRGDNYFTPSFYTLTKINYCENNISVVVDINNIPPLKRVMSKVMKANERRKYIKELNRKDPSIKKINKVQNKKRRNKGRLIKKEMYFQERSVQI